MKRNKNENGVENKSVKNKQLYEKQQLVDEDLEECEDNLSDSKNLENVNNEGGFETEKVNSYDSTVPFNEPLRDCSVKPSRNTYVKGSLKVGGNLPLKYCISGVLAKKNPTHPLWAKEGYSPANPPHF